MSQPPEAPCSSPSLSAALRPGEAAPGAHERARHPHPEDVSGLAVPDPVPADAQEPDHHLRLVPGPCGEEGAGRGPGCTAPSPSSSREGAIWQGGAVSTPRSQPGKRSPGWAWGYGPQVRAPLLTLPPPHSPLQQKNRYKQMKRSVLLLQAYARGWKVRAGHPAGSWGRAPGPAALPARAGAGGTRWGRGGAPRLCHALGDLAHPISLRLSFLLSCLSLPLAPYVCWCFSLHLWAPLGSDCPAAVSQAPPGAEGPAPPPPGRQHHFCLLERVQGNGASPPRGAACP